MSGDGLTLTLRGPADEKLLLTLLSDMASGPLLVVLVSSFENKTCHALPFCLDITQKHVVVIQLCPSSASTR